MNSAEHFLSALREILGAGKRAAAGQKGSGVVIDMRRSTMRVDNNIYKIPTGAGRT